MGWHAVVLKSMWLHLNRLSFKISVPIEAGIQYHNFNCPATAGSYYTEQGREVIKIYSSHSTRIPVEMGKIMPYDVFLVPLEGVSVLSNDTTTAMTHIPHYVILLNVPVLPMYTFIPFLTCSIKHDLVVYTLQDMKKNCLQLIINGLHVLPHMRTKS